MSKKYLKNHFVKLISIQNTNVAIISYFLRNYLRESGRLSPIIDHGCLVSVDSGAQDCEVKLLENDFNEYMLYPGQILTGVALSTAAEVPKISIPSANSTGWSACAADEYPGICFNSSKFEAPPFPHGIVRYKSRGLGGIVLTYSLPSNNCSNL